MRISLNWLNDYIDIKNIPAETIANTLTDIGLEVEAIEKIEPLKGSVIVGEVLEATQHPDAEKLRVCRVNVGSAEPLEIVCGAHNARAGIKVCVATVGSTLPGDFKIKKSKIRGVFSSGMLCAEDELGLGGDHDGIIEVPADVVIGTNVSELYQMNDTVLELGITPNRADCLGYLGIARDLAAKLGIPLRTPNLDHLDLDANLKSEDKITVQVSDTLECPRFCALYVEGVSSLPSPHWLQRRLEASGMRPINLLVDATNYVMLEYGQPIHAYDQRDLRSNKIEVRRANLDDAFQTLDGETRKLAGSDLLIWDGQGPVGLAGIMGGLNSEVKEDTSAIIIEVASFNGSMIRKTAKRLGLHTEASHRFERGTDVHACDTVAYRTAGLIQQLCREMGASRLPQIASTIVDVYPTPWRGVSVALRTSRCRQVLGAATLTSQEIATALESLQFPMVDRTEGGERMLFNVPSWRRDICREIDLIEEVGRIRGYDRIDYRLPLMEIGGIAENPFIDFLDKVRITVAQSGLNEIISLPFVGRKDLQNFRLPSEHPYAHPVRLANPLAEEEGLMQPMLMISLSKALLRNRRRGNRGVRLFEIGRGYLSPLAMKFSSGEYLDHLDNIGGHLSERAKDDSRAIEHNYLGAILDQPWQEKSWLGGAEASTFFHGKALVEMWLGGFAVSGISFKPIGDVLIPYLHPASSAMIMSGDLALGYLGEMHPEVALAYEFDPNQTPIVIEINLERFYLAQSEKLRFETELQRFPPVVLDLAFVVEEAITNAQIEAAIANFKRRKHLVANRLFDVYKGENVPDGKKSMAYSLQFQSPKKTLNDEEVEKEVAALKDWLKQEVGAELR